MWHHNKTNAFHRTLILNSWHHVADNGYGRERKMKCPMIIVGNRAPGRGDA